MWPLLRLLAAYSNMLPHSTRSRCPCLMMAHLMMTPSGGRLPWLLYGTARTHLDGIISALDEGSLFIIGWAQAGSGRLMFGEIAAGGFSLLWPGWFSSQVQPN